MQKKVSPIVLKPIERRYLPGEESHLDCVNVFAISKNSGKIKLSL